MFNITVCEKCYDTIGMHIGKSDALERFYNHLVQDKTSLSLEEFSYIAYMAITYVR